MGSDAARVTARDPQLRRASRAPRIPKAAAVGSDSRDDARPGHRPRPSPMRVRRAPQNVLSHRTGGHEGFPRRETRLAERTGVVLIGFSASIHFMKRSPQQRAVDAYSLRSAVIGSIRMARRVGTEPAINATSKRTPATATSVAGSVGVTSKSDF